MTTGRTLQGPFADPIRKHLETARRQISQGQLKQAAQQSTAHSYIHDGSFYLDVNTDHFLYESTTRRKIENNDRNQALGVRHTLSALVAVGLRDLTHKPVLTR